MSSSNSNACVRPSACVDQAIRVRGGSSASVRLWIPLELFLMLNRSCAYRPRASAISRSRLPSGSSYLIQEATRNAAKEIMSSVEMKPSKWGNGLFASRPVSVGEVMLSVPRDACLIISFEGTDKNEGEILVPKDGTWPRLMQGLGFEDPLTWDVLLALALLDAVSGDGGALWQEYALNVLPSPSSLTVPFCWSQSRLEALDHQEIIEVRNTLHPY